MYNTLVQEFSVGKKMVAMVTNNATNMKKAFPDVDISTPASEAEDEGSVEGDDLEIHRVDINWDDIQDAHIPVPIPRRFSCVAHTLQLVVNDGSKEGTDKIKSRC